jgi:hypothetical protein
MNSLTTSGSLITTMMVLSCISVLLFAGLLFGGETLAVELQRRHEDRQRQKWAGCTTDPPSTKWQTVGEKSYACFLSHYKVEAASDARLMHDMLAKMLQYPIFLDSAKLTDLRLLITNGVADCDVMLILGTKGYITRPWCLLEIVHSARLKVPVVIVEVKNGNFNVDESQHYINNIEEIMGTENPSGLDLLYEHLGEDLAELKVACTQALQDFSASRFPLTWNPNASDSELIACLKDISDAMATACGGTLLWKCDAAQLRREKKAVKGASPMRSMRLNLSRNKEAVNAAMHIVCSCDDALNDARVLHIEMAMKLGRLVSINMPDGSQTKMASNAEAMGVLLTKNLLFEPAALFEIYQAAEQGKTIIPLCLIGRGYDYAGASNHLSNLEAGLSEAKLTELKELLHAHSSAAPDDRFQRDQPAGGVTRIQPINQLGVPDLQATVLATLPRLIAVNWEPEGGKNQLDATVSNVLTRIVEGQAPKPQAKPATTLKTSAGVTTTRAAIRLVMLQNAAAKVKAAEQSNSCKMSSTLQEAEGESPDKEVAATMAPDLERELKI